MRTPIVGLAALLAACDPPRDAGDDTACRSGAEPVARPSRREDDVFMDLQPGEALESVVSPQGGFGLVFWVESEGIAADEDHLVDIEIDALQDGMIVGGYRVADAPLTCEAEQPGRWGAVLLTLDQERFVVPQDLEELAGDDIDLVLSLTDAAGTIANGAHVIRIIPVP